MRDCDDEHAGRLCMNKRANDWLQMLFAELGWDSQTHQALGWKVIYELLAEQPTISDDVTSQPCKMLVN